MSRIRSKNTKPEMLVRKFLFSKGFRFRIHVKELHGKPDIVLNKYKTVIFIHGCFWHGHEQCDLFKVPSTDTEFWIAKINRNKQLDIENFSKLSAEGWRVITIFECQLKKNFKDRTLNELIAELH